jgi:hypothetical protein
MYKTGIVGLALVISLAVSATYAFAEETKQENKLIGTWKVISSTLPDGFTQVKHVTPVQFMMNGLGGSYTLKGDVYVEIPEYGVGEEQLEVLKGKPQSFKWKIEAHKWHHTGKLSTGQPIKEVWERVQNR